MWYVSIQSVVLGPIALILYENLLEDKILDPTSDLLNQNLCFIEASGWFVNTLKSEKHCSNVSFQRIPLMLIIK